MNQSFHIVSPQNGASLIVKFLDPFFRQEKNTAPTLAVPFYKQGFPLSHLKKIAPNWPLSAGSVQKNPLAWNTITTSGAVVQAALAFWIKTLSVHLFLEKKIPNSDHFDFLPLFKSNEVQFIFWEDLKIFYQQYEKEKKIFQNKKNIFQSYFIRNKKLIILCLEDKIFKLRTGVNEEISIFQEFIDDAYFFNAKLVVFSLQQLIKNKDQKKFNFKPADYSYNFSKLGSKSPTFKGSLSFKAQEVYKNISIEEVLEPASFFVGLDNHEGYRLANRTGLFDKILELLSAGQNDVDKVNAAYS